MNDFDIVVVTSPNRKALVLSYLAGTDAIISVTPNYDLPVNFRPTVGGLTHNHLGTYRCFQGHQNAVAQVSKDYALILEDDAVPNKAFWFDDISKSLDLLGEFEMISFHGRQHNLNAFDFVRPNIVKPVYHKPWIVAALAYAVKRESYEKLLSFKYDGTPWDLVLYNNFNYCLMLESPFDHDRSEGSLVD